MEQQPELEVRPAALPAWADELRAYYASGSTNTFLLHGNVNDRFLINPREGARLGTLEDFLATELLGNFDIIFTYDAGNGVRLMKGGQLWQQLTSQSEALGSLPQKSPRPSIEFLTHAIRYLANLARNSDRHYRVACILRDLQLIAPISWGGYQSDTTPAMLLIREWSREELITESHFAAFLFAENLSELHPLLANNPRSLQVAVPLPDRSMIEQLLGSTRQRFPDGFTGKSPEEIRHFADALAGASAALIESTLRLKTFRKEALNDDDLVAMKKGMIERDAAGLIEFLPPKQTLDDLQGQDYVKQVLRRDLGLWRSGQTETCPMGYLVCGPVGTGKTFMVRCLAGEAGVPVVRLKNFRDRWVGSSEANLERIFRLLKALGRCMVFVDEADQALGKRDSGDSTGVSNRIYSLFAEEMSNTDNRGKIVWVLASSRPDLIEVDLKRPGRMDVRIPLFPCLTSEEGFALLRALCARNGLALEITNAAELGVPIPELLTPGAADSIAREARKVRDFEKVSAVDAVRAILRDYAPPIAPAVLEGQIAITVREASDLRFVPEAYRHYRATKEVAS